VDVIDTAEPALIIKGPEWPREVPPPAPRSDGASTEGRVALVLSEADVPHYQSDITSYPSGVVVYSDSEQSAENLIQHETWQRISTEFESSPLPLVAVIPVDTFTKLHRGTSAPEIYGFNRGRTIDRDRIKIVNVLISHLCVLVSKCQSKGCSWALIVHPISEVSEALFNMTDIKRIMTSELVHCYNVGVPGGEEKSGPWIITNKIPEENIVLITNVTIARSHNDKVTIKSSKESDLLAMGELLKVLSWKRLRVAILLGLWYQ